MAITVQQFIDRLTESGLMSAVEVSTFQGSLPPDKRPKDLQTLVIALCRAGKLTKYQAKAVYEGKGKSLVFGEYTVLEQIGEGGMGVVLKAQHRRMDRLVAIKVLSSTAMKQAGAVERFQREVKAAAKLSHANIVTAHDAGEHQGMHYLAMEYVEGQDLARTVKEQGPLPVRRAVECILQAARGLQYAHEQDIVHRDIKPGNLLSDKKGTVKILDMGLARIAGAEAALGGPERLTATGQVMGTCDYMAPEQAFDSHNVDLRADIYSLGCTLYRLLTGSPPYARESLMQILVAHREDPIPSLCQARPEVSAELDECFQRMVAKRPEDRQQSMAEVIVDLEAVLAVLSGRSATALSAESPSEMVARNLAFLQEAAPRSTLTKQKKPAATERTQPHVGLEHDTASSLFGMARATVARVGRRPLVLLGIGGGLVLLLLLGLVLTFTLRQGTLVVEIDEQLGKDVQVAVSQGGEKVQVADAKSGWTLRLSSGEYDLAVEGGDDQFQLDSHTVAVTRGGQVKVRVTLKPAPLAVAPFDGKQAGNYQEHWARQLGVPVEITNSIGMKLVLIPPGEFTMGSPRELIEEELKTHTGNQGEDERWYVEHLPGEVPQHRVRITKPFYFGVYVVTQEEYQRVMGTNPSEFSVTGKEKDKVAGQDTKRFPVEQVSWDDAVEFCRKLSEMPPEKAARRTYRLPSEAQWEHACRAGSTGRFSFSSGRSGISKESEERKLYDYGWFSGNSGGMTHAVGGKRPSAWGLYDIHGNVWEWCQDWYDKDYYLSAKSSADDPTGPPRGSHRVIHGGCWFHPAGFCRSAYRDLDEAGFRHYDLGFRASLVLSETAAERAKISHTTDATPASGGAAAAKPSPAVASLDSQSPAHLPAVVPSVASKEEPKPGIPPSEGPKPPATKEATPDVAPAVLVPKPSGPNEVKAPLKKLDPPSVDEQKRLIREIDEVYKSGEAKDQVAKAALARKLLESGRKTSADRAEQFVLLRRAGEMACDAGEADLMLEAVDAIAAAGFNIQPIQVKSRFWKRLLEQVSSGSAHQVSTVIGSCVRFAEGAAAGGAVDEASEVLDAARNTLAESKKRVQTALRSARVAIARSRNSADKAAREKKAAEAQAEMEDLDTALGALAECAKGLQQARREHEALQAARQRLKTAPDDPDACLAVGRWSCFYQGDWDGGLKLLAKGSDRGLKSLAAEELASKPTKAEARLARADAWWALAEKTAGIAKSAMRRRAGHWYQQAMPDLAPGLEKSRVEERLAQADEEPLSEADGGAARVRPPLAIAPFSEKTGKIFQARWAKYLCVPMVQTNSISMKLVLIPPGEFMMGSPKELIEEELKAHGDDAYYKRHLPFEGPKHRVRITRPFYLGMYEVTQEEYWRVMGANPSLFSATGSRKDQVAGQDTRRFPVDSVSWANAAEFCRKLSEMPEEKAAGRWYRLPSEAQWEYACRAGSTGRYSFSPRLQPISKEGDEKALSDYGWFDGNSGGTTHAVGGKRASTWGLYDMHGNVWEFCQDWLGEGYYANSVTDDPVGPLEGGARVLRGGGSADPAAFCRSAFRLAYDWGGAGPASLPGFRVSVVLADTAAERAATSPASDATQSSGGSAADNPSPAAASPDSQPIVRLPAVGSLVGANGKWQLPPGAPATAVAPFDETKAKEHQEGWAKQLGMPVEVNSSIGMKLAFIPPGEFMMGSPKELIEAEWSAHRDDQGYTDELPTEGPQHRVRITRPFYLGRYKVTQEEYQRAVGVNPSQFSATGQYKDRVTGQDTRRFPVENVSYDEAAVFCRKLSEMPGEKAAGRTYRLPSEAQWEYACRTGSTGRFSFSPGQGATAKEDEEQELSGYGWFSGNSDNMTHAVGGKRASAWGLYDMYGNVFEWCRDVRGQDYDAKSVTDDPIGPLEGAQRLLRGGCFFISARCCRSAYSMGRDRGWHDCYAGFRVCLVLPDK